MAISRIWHFGYICTWLSVVYDILDIYVHGYQSISRRKLYGWVFIQSLCSHSQHKFLLTKRLMRIDDMSWKMLMFVLTFYPATFSACPKPRSGFPLAHVVVFLSSMIWSEMYLLVSWIYDHHCLIKLYFVVC
jgi:hypothetical protein